MQIKKRDGRLVPFDKTKIITAILAAFKEIDGEITPYAEKKANNIADYIAEISKEKELSISDIQSLVEHGLMSTKRKDVATAYIEYRAKRDKIRNWNSNMMNVVEEKLMAKNVINQNANVDEHSFGGRKGEAISEILRQHALDNCMSEISRNNHLNNEIYIHDLDSYSLGLHNCLSLPFDDLLAKGFNTRQTDVRSANSVSTAFQLVAVLFQLQSLQQFGGCAATHLDWTMVPYVRKSFRKHYIDGLKYLRHINDEDLFSSIPVETGIEDEKYKNYNDVYEYAIDMTKKETYQAVEGMFHNLNTLQSRSGN